MNERDIQYIFDRFNSLSKSNRPLLFGVFCALTCSGFASIYIHVSHIFYGGYLSFVGGGYDAFTYSALVAGLAVSLIFSWFFERLLYLKLIYVSTKVRLSERGEGHAATALIKCVSVFVILTVLLDLIVLLPQIKSFGFWVLSIGCMLQIIFGIYIVSLSYTARFKRVDEIDEVRFRFNFMRRVSLIGQDTISIFLNNFKQVHSL